MINIFGVFLPQLLRYPNPTDPLNGEAAALLMREPAAYEAKVKGIQCVLHHFIIIKNMYLNMRQKKQQMQLQMRVHRMK